jgi:hypothetical protein
MKLKEIHTLEGGCKWLTVNCTTELPGSTVHYFPMVFPLQQYD